MAIRSATRRAGSAWQHCQGAIPRRQPRHARRAPRTFPRPLGAPRLLAAASSNLWRVLVDGPQRRQQRRRRRVVRRRDAAGDEQQLLKCERLARGEGQRAGAGGATGGGEGSAAGRRHAGTACQGPLAIHPAPPAAIAHSPWPPIGPPSSAPRPPACAAAGTASPAPAAAPPAAGPSRAPTRTTPGTSAAARSAGPGPRRRSARGVRGRPVRSRPREGGRVACAHAVHTVVRACVFGGGVEPDVHANVLPRVCTWGSVCMPGACDRRHLRARMNPASKFELHPDCRVGARNRSSTTPCAPGLLLTSTLLASSNRCSCSSSMCSMRGRTSGHWYLRRRGRGVSRGGGPDHPSSAEVQQRAHRMMPVSAISATSPLSGSVSSRVLRGRAGKGRRGAASLRDPAAGGGACRAAPQTPRGGPRF
jgi:hypothetical protein